MPTTPPDRLTDALSDRYRIERELGQGGMATVYLAQDLKHDRQVAVKVLLPELAAVIGADRFLSEIKTTANLQHPHILPLFDSGAADSFLFYVMPFVEGESLRDRLNREKQLPVGDAVRIATEVAGALDYAHRHNVIHRDIKPENILLQDGAAVVADFGIALAATNAGGLRLTETGLSLGTPHYMSPEQAMGERDLTARTDVYALGCVLYEMLTGEPPFTGPTPQSITARKLAGPVPSIRSVRETVPLALEQVIERALSMVPADRYGSCRELMVSLASTVTPQPSPRSTRSFTQRRPRWQIWVLGALLAGAAVAVVRQSRSGPAPVAIGRRVALAVSPDAELSPSISPDGRLVSFTLQTPATTRLFTQQVTEGTPVPVATQLEGAQQQGVFSPDGNRLLFRGPDGLYVVPALGGQARLVVPRLPNRATGWGGWAPDGSRIVYYQGGAAYIQAVDSSYQKQLTAGQQLHSFAWSPDGKWIAFVSGNPDFHDDGNIAPSGLRLIPATGGPVIALTDSLSLNTSPIWVPGSRSLLFISDRDGGRDIYQLFLSRSGAPAGPPTRLTTGLDPEQISLSIDGKRMVWSTLTRTSSIWSVQIPASGTIQLGAARQETAGTQFIENIAVSPDGRWLYYDSNRNGNQDIWRMSLPHGQPEVLTKDRADDFQPAVSPDGREVAFHSMRTGNRDIFVVPATGGIGTQVTTGKEQDRQAFWSGDGRTLGWTSTDSTITAWTVRRDSSGSWGAPTQLPLENAWAEAWSPDNRWILYWDSGGSALWNPMSGERRLLPREFLPIAAAWSEDSRMVYEVATERESDRRVLVSIDVATGTVHMFATPGTPWLQSMFGFAEHGGRFYFVLPNIQSDIWVGEVTVP